MASIAISSDAYCVLFMHSCKYPSRTVNGLLLGSASGGAVSVRKALPLFHSPLGLAPMLEAALMLVHSRPDQRCPSCRLSEHHPLPPFAPARYRIG